MGDQFEAESLLVEVAASHNLSVSPDEIRAALYDDRHGADLARWAASNLAPDNLLTVDELSLYDALDKSGQVDRLAELYDLSEMQPLRQDDVRAAVDDLRLSTESMNKQAETLRHQRDAWQRLVANRADTVAKRRELETSRQRKSDSERITEIAHGLKFRIAELKHDSDPNVTSLHQALDVVLKSDDALLTSLQKLGWELSEPDPEEAKSTDKLRETCLRLIKITVETIRTRLDTTYLTALATAQQSQDTSADPDEIEALQAELESLYSEILPVAQMSVEQQHLEPALGSIASRSGQSLRKTASSLKYINQCFDYLLSRINALHTHTELYNAHHAAVNRVVATARDEMAAEVPAPDPQPTNSIEAPSPIKPPTRTKRHSRDMTHRRRSSGTPHLTALDSLMQSLALPMDAYGDASGATSQITALSRLVRERRSKNNGAARSAQDEFEAATAERLDDAQRAVQLLWDSVLAETAFGTATLADPGIEQSIDVLAQEVTKAKDKLGRFESQQMGWGSLKRDEFIERWAR
ncbi:vacuolar H+/Ca2+ exchanger [Beauveria brongniartii RCEF 3172]|uniref:Vacuolar H+/Ca2+ exchanger n=1 Tax=Beauveria brongniartii RCEF 3172 TaxID=1081107 RepID=A0A167GJZ4_9HYPO|nr:vacuolar H+/Ca2+ exchanger [Beauveria brongniartii RCEF 3172]